MPPLKHRATTLTIVNIITPNTTYIMDLKIVVKHEIYLFIFIYCQTQLTNSATNVPITAPNAPNLDIKNQFTTKLTPAPQNTDSINIFSL